MTGRRQAPLPSSGAMRKGQKAMQVPAQRNQPSEFLETPQMVATPAAVRQVPINREPSSEVEQQKMPTQYVSVKPGDTLWSIAQKYRVNVESSADAQSIDRQHDCRLARPCGYRMSAYVRGRCRQGCVDTVSLLSCYPPDIRAHLTMAVFAYRVARP